MKKTIAILTLILIAGCSGGKKSQNITVRGSDTMVLIGQKWAEVYMGKFPSQIIQVNGGGSGTGFSALLNETTDICQASRPIKEKEKASIKEKYKSDALEIAVAKDGIAIYTHPDNPIKNLTLEDLKNIFTGKITTWETFTGKKDPILIYGRENSSGTYEFFKEHVLKGEDFAKQVQTLPGTAAIVSAVKNDKNSLGYGGISYSSGVKIVPVKKTKEDVEGTTPTQESVAKNTYPISRDLYFYLARQPKEMEKQFIDWVLSNEGQKLAVSQGYMPIREIK